MIKRLAVFLLLLLACRDLRAQLNAYFIDVGQGDAVYLELPSGGNVLIDGGPWASSATLFLQQKGVTKIDHVVLTHPHSDHYNGLMAAFGEMQVSNFYDTRLDNASATGDNTVRSLAAGEPGCATHYPAAGEKLNWDPKVEVLALNSCPAASSTNKSDVVNNCSIVLRIRYNGVSMLLMGDAGGPVEDAMLMGAGSDLRASVLKIGHHGSRRSSSQAFLSAVRPAYAYISVARDNDYGHPHREVLDRLNAVGARVFLTTEGTQSFSIPAPGAGAQGGPGAWNPAALKDFIPSYQAGPSTDPADGRDDTDLY